MSISGADVRHMAALARVGVVEERVPLLVAELNGILSHMEALQRVELPDDLADSANAPVYGPSRMPLAEDIRSAVPLERSREQFAPAMRDGFFLVPRLSTHGTVGASAAGAEQADAAVAPDVASRDDEIGE